MLRIIAPPAFLWKRGLVPIGRLSRWYPGEPKRSCHLAHDDDSSPVAETRGIPPLNRIGRRDTFYELIKVSI